MLNILKSLYLVIVRGWVPLPLTEYPLITVSDESILMTTSDPKSVEVALWALDKKEHYWRATSNGVVVKEISESEGSESLEP